MTSFFSVKQRSWPLDYQNNCKRGNFELNSHLIRLHEIKRSALHIHCKNAAKENIRSSQEFKISIGIVKTIRCFPEPPTSSLLSSLYFIYFLLQYCKAQTPWSPAAFSVAAKCLQAFSSTGQATSSQWPIQAASCTPSLFHMLINGFFTAPSEAKLIITVYLFVWMNTSLMKKDFMQICTL